MQSREREAEKRQQSTHSLEMDQFGISIIRKWCLAIDSTSCIQITPSIVDLDSKLVNHLKFFILFLSPYLFSLSLTYCVFGVFVYWFYCVERFKFGARISMSKISWNGTTAAPELERFKHAQATVISSCKKEVDRNYGKYVIIDKMENMLPVATMIKHFHCYSAVEHGWTPASLMEKEYARNRRLWKMKERKKNGWNSAIKMHSLHIRCHFFVLVFFN